MKIVYRGAVFFIFVSILIVVILYARGYRFDLNSKSVTSTGILAVSTYPKAAKVFINDELKGASDINLSLPPGTYRIEIKKEGYTTWEKTVMLKGELVVTADALLLPVSPSLSSLTNLGIVKAIALGQTEKIILFSQNNDEEKDGIYLFDATKKTFSFFPPLKLIILKKDLESDVKLENASLIYSPDYKQGVISFSPSRSYLISLDEQNDNTIEVSKSKDQLIQAWEKEKKKIQSKILETFPKEFAKIASDSFHIVDFSPDETKVLYYPKTSVTLPIMISPRLISVNQTKEERTLKKDNLYIYDKREDKNYNINSVKLIPPESTVLWHPDSKHLFFNESLKISIIEYDGINKQTVYSGPFVGPFFTVTNNGQIIILGNLNPENNPFPDLYAVIL